MSLLVLCSSYFCFLALFLFLAGLLLHATFAVVVVPEAKLPSVLFLSTPSYAQSCPNQKRNSAVGFPFVCVPFGWHLFFNWCLQHCTYSLALSCFLVLGDVFSSVLCVAPLHSSFLVLSSLSFFPCLVACLLLSSFLFGVSSRGICSRFCLCLRCVFCGFRVYLCVCQLTGRQKKKTTEDARAETKCKEKTKPEPKQLKRNRPHTGINRPHTGINRVLS